MAVYDNAPKLHREQIIARARLQSENIGQMLLDYAYWNAHVKKPDEEAIDVDPGGLLLRLKEGIDRMLAAEDARPIPPFMSVRPPICSDLWHIPVVGDDVYGSRKSDRCPSCGALKSL